VLANASQARHYGAKYCTFSARRGWIRYRHNGTEQAMAHDFDIVGRTLLASLLIEHPDWDRYADADENGFLQLWIPVPYQPTHNLEVVQRGGQPQRDTIEVAYDLGLPRLRAERQYVFNVAEVDDAVSEVAAFVRALCTGEVVVLEEPVGRIFGALRGDGIRTSACFRDRTEIAEASLGPHATVHEWRTYLTAR
jgi:hypothetical protein